MTFGDKLKSIRIGTNMTQEELAKRLGLARKTIRMYEAGETIPRFARIYEQLSEIFGTDVDFWKENRERDFETAANIAYGAEGKIQAHRLLESAAGLFAGGSLSDEDKEEVYIALQKIYWEIKEEKNAQTQDTDLDT